MIWGFRRLGQSRNVSPRTTLTFDQYLDRWSALHEGVNPRENWLILGWLRCAYACARPLSALGATPNAVTILGVFAAGLVPLCAALSQSLTSPIWLWVATFLVPFAGLVDSLDGAVAVLRGMTSRFGFVLDSVCDRLGEILLCSSLWIAGGNHALVAFSVLLGFLVEYARARSRVVDPDWDPPLTIAERPTRLIIVGVFLGLAAWAPFGVDPGDWATLGAGLGTIVATIGVGQMMWQTRDHLSPRPGN